MRSGLRPDGLYGVSFVFAHAGAVFLSADFLVADFGGDVLGRGGDEESVAVFYSAGSDGNSGGVVN